MIASLSRERIASAITPSHWSIWLVVITIAGFGLRIFRLDQHRLWYDEAYVAAAILNSVSHLWLEFPKIEPHPPVFFTLEWAASAILGVDAVSLRIGPALIGSLLVPLSVITLRRFIGPLASLVAGFGLA